MSNSYVRPPHYQRHHQSMLLNLCSIHPHFETDNFDREYQKELASCIWRIPGKYGGPEYIVQQQVGQLPPTLESAEQPAPAITADFFDNILESLGTLSRPAKPVQPIRVQAPETSKAAYENTWISQASKYTSFGPNTSTPRLPQRLRLSESPYTSAQDSQGFANAPVNPEGLGISQTSNEFSVSTTGPDPPTSTPSSLLAARLALPGFPNPNPNPIATSNSAPAAPSSSLAPLPPLLLPDSVVKDPDTGELITIKMFERRCLGRGAEIAIRQAQAAVKATPNRMTKPVARLLLEDSLTTALANIIQEQSQQLKCKIRT
ncbi:uncharacterized protein EAF02_010310 [Botrytis sinoallii]|uniref:uncharacterized protein n=1 Tax=Botrytis sinoallii TaxID=1463999 RepID=UPI0018FFC164|nr:uncharacterized protein EAF02_010310 [Botrytis sinoallii]KAF7864342.1 hypothetical protein EAF02_010310 [Botrytis sinoallii]